VPAQLKQLLSLAICAAFLSLVPVESPGEATESDGDAFESWARDSRIALSVIGEGDPQDLGALEALIDRADIVALGEGVHLAAEPLEFRDQLIQHLVRDKGFTAKSTGTAVSSLVGCQAGVDGGGTSPATQCLSSDL
jgi:erythromycin esterase-like protein